MDGLSDIPPECLEFVANAVGDGDPLKLLMSLMPRLSVECRNAARRCLVELTSLNLSCCHNITDVAVTAVAVACPQLTSLNLSGCKSITDAAVTAVNAAHPQLRVRR